MQKSYNRFDLKRFSLLKFIFIVKFTITHHDLSQLAHNVVSTSIQRYLDVMDVVLTLCAGWVHKVSHLTLLSMFQEMPQQQ